MDHITIMSGDNLLVITALPRVTLPNAYGIHRDGGKSTVTSTDLLTNKSVTSTWTDKQVQAVLVLFAVDEDGFLKSNHFLDLWKIAEDAMSTWPIECRLLPC